MMHHIRRAFLVDATGEAWWKDAAATTGALWQYSLWIIGV